jgi:ubiquinone/menaquinone biosynthesis C-methylase UbiE|tara:strand:+ start:785 stop:1468 length:684 start_codon:yes stop_codon:yes gene_type:complete
MTQDNDPDRNAVLREYARLAGDYDSRWSFYIRATTRETIARLSVQAADNVLDIGCGTGAMLTQLVDLFPNAAFHGLDASSEMLDVARDRLPSRIELKQGWAEQLPYSDGTFNTVVSCNMFHYIRRPDAALDEMHRVLRPHGTLVITDWCDDYLACKLCDWYLRCCDRSHFRTYGVRQCRRLLKSADAQNITIEKYKSTWLWGLMTAVSQKSPESQTSIASAPSQSAT